MKKTTLNQIAKLGINSAHVSIAELADFALQSPDLDPRNYYHDHTDRDGMRAYREELGQIHQDLTRFKEALAECANLSVPEAFVIDAAKSAFSGRLEWKFDHWEYTTGQYFPTEYRKAAASVLEMANARFRQSRTPQKRQIKSIQELKALAHENGSHWFDKSSMRYFGTRIESGILFGRYFITSEQPPNGPRRFSVRTFDSEADIETVGEFASMRSRGEAMQFLKTHMKGNEVTA